MGKALILGLFLILGLDTFSLALHWYSQVTWLDSLLHFLGGIWVAAFFFWFAGWRIETPSFLWKAALAVSFVALIGVLWELAEFTFLNALMVKIFGAQEVEMSLIDTIADLTFDLLGGLVAAAAYKNYTSK